MDGKQRRENILHILSTSQQPVAGDRIAKSMKVSRQVIVQDIALLRANGHVIVSTNRGYMLQSEKLCVRVLKVYHTDEQTEEEMSTIVDFGGRIQDVFVYHKVYGILRAEMNIKSRRDVRLYLEKMSTGTSSLLKNITGGYHYHTIYADSVEILDDIQQELANLGFLAKLQDYEPVDFWSEAK